MNHSAAAYILLGSSFVFLITSVVIAFLGGSVLWWETLPGTIMIVIFGFVIALVTEWEEYKE